MRRIRIQKFAGTKDVQPNSKEDFLEIKEKYVIPRYDSAKPSLEARQQSTPSLSLIVTPARRCLRLISWEATSVCRSTIGTILYVLVQSIFSIRKTDDNFDAVVDLRPIRPTCRQSGTSDREAIILRISICFSMAFVNEEGKTPNGNNGLGDGLDYDVLIVGGGLSGIYSLHRMQELGIRVKLLEAGSAEGGTWFW